MRETTSGSRAGDTGRGAVARSAMRDGQGIGLAAIVSRISIKARWTISAALGLLAPAVWIGESAAAPIVAAMDAMVCFGNGSILALAANANAFTMIP